MAWRGCCSNERLCCRSSAFKINQFCRPSFFSQPPSPLLPYRRPTISSDETASHCCVGVSSFEVERPPSVSLHRCSTFARSLTFISSRPPILRSLPLQFTPKYSGVLLSSSQPCKHPLPLILAGWSDLGGIRVERRKSARHLLYLKSAIVLGQEPRGSLIKFGKGSPTF